MNIKTEHNDEKAHHYVKDGSDENAFHAPLSSAGPQFWQEQYRAQQKLDAAQNGEDIHMASVLSNFRLNHNS